MNSDQSLVTIQQLQVLFTNKIENIVGTVRDKLQEDARKDNLVGEDEDTAVASAQQDSNLQARKQG